MNTRSTLRPAHAAFLALCLLIPPATPAFSAEPATKPAPAPKPAPAAKPTPAPTFTPQQTQSLSQILPNPADWTLPPKNIALIDANGQPALATNTKIPLVLETKAPISAPSQFTAIFRLHPDAKATASINLQLFPQVKPDKTITSVQFSVSATDAINALNAGLVISGYKELKPSRDTIYFDPVSDVSLAWSEEMRATIESQIANAPKVQDTLLIAHCTFDGNTVRAWINGRYIGQQAIPAELQKSGTFKITASPNTQLLSLRIAPLAQPSLFEPVSLHSNTNSTKLAGDSVLASSLPGQPNPDSIAAGRTATINNIPFEFPSPTTSPSSTSPSSTSSSPPSSTLYSVPGTRDSAASAPSAPSADLGQSWTRFGALPGYFKSNSGAFNGRWTAAHRIDPARIAMHIPTARYKALHVVAVADGRPDSLPILSAQFYRPDAGHPITFSNDRIPSLGDKATVSSAVPVKLASGKDATLYQITIPLDPDSFSWFSDLDKIGLEITKQVHYYRAYPDPLEYSHHAGGLPSSVQLYAMTLERADLDVDLIPDTYGHIWTAPQTPKYNILLKNDSGKASKVHLTINTASSDGLDKTTQTQEVTLPASNTPLSVPVELKPTRYGLHEIAVTISGPDIPANTFKRNFAHLHPDTREQALWEQGRGPIFGFWGWGGGHDTPTTDREIPVMAAAGAETSTRNYGKADPEILALAQKHRFISEAAFSGGAMYITGFVSASKDAPKWNPEKTEESGQAVVEFLKKDEVPLGPVSRPTYVPFFAEPQIGNITTGIWPSWYGEDYKLTEYEQKTFESMLARYMASASAIRKQWPNIKLLIPYGDPMNAVVFLKHSKEVAPLIDGSALDLPGFERLPEQQVNQVVLNRMYPVLSDVRKYKPDAYFVLVEGTHVSSKDIDTGQTGQAQISIRNYLTLMGYGITKFESGNSPFDCANYWGENHYGGGWMSRKPMSMPKLGYAQLAALTRNLNRCNFVKYLPTTSTSTYAQQYKHYKTGQLVHTFWTIRGTRDVSLKVPAGTTLTLFDPQDNPTTLKESNGQITFKIGQSPVFIHGLTSDPIISLSEPDHSDSLPSILAKKLASPADGSWQLVTESDEDYQKNKPLQIERFPGNMTAKPVDAPAPQGAKALAIHLGEQEKDRGVMPFFTTLKPSKPQQIPGKGASLGLWVHASSDWGRVVYSLRDAKGEKWISVGSKEDWNCDDIHGWSNFCFDGWRYLTFPLPSNLPYDSFRERGSSWWGSYGGDGIVDLPLSLEKIIIERRPKAIVGNDLVPVKADDVLLGDLNVEYASLDDQSSQAVRLSALRMPLPPAADTTGMKNPIKEMQESGTAAPTTVLGVKDPEHEYDGTRCLVNFTTVPDAKTYDVWVSAYSDGRGALKLGKAWTESGKLIRGMRPDREFWVFVTYNTSDGKTSKPSEGLKFILKDRFGYK